MEIAMDTKELERMFNVTSEEIEKWDEEACNGILPGKSRGDVIVGPGRPKVFWEKTQQIGFREPESKARIISKRANSLGIKRSEYLRRLVDEDLRKVGML